MTCDGLGRHLSCCANPPDDAARDMNDPEPGSSTSSKARVPANLRFQRRISERAFSETSYRDNTMEYPGAGTSPWASSPEASRTSFSNDVPREDLPGPALQQEGGEAGGSASAAGVAANGDEHQQQQNYTYGGPGSWSPEQQHQWQHQQSHQQHDQQAQPVRTPGEENRRPQSARYHGVPPQQRQHVPQYKLQAKITGMERSGKKDPILKFDVHVRHCAAHRWEEMCVLTAA